MNNIIEMLDYRSHEVKILTRNGKDWLDFCLGFTADEIADMDWYIKNNPWHTVDRDYNYNSLDDVSDLVYEYITHWIIDALEEGDTHEAQKVMNAAFI